MLFRSPAPLNEVLRRAAVLAALCATVLGARAQAILPEGFYETELRGFVSSPTAMAIGPDGLILVCEQAGALRWGRGGAMQPNPFVTVPAQAFQERGLAGVVFDPGFATNRFFYLYYTTTQPTIHNRLSRFTAGETNAVPGSEAILLELPTLGSSGWHNGGSMGFAPDGKLFLGVGDNSSGARAQSLDSILGKILRLNPDGTVDSSFNALGSGPNGRVRSLQIDTSGRILIGGDFTTVGGVARGRIARLNSNGTLDLNFNPGLGFANGSVNTLAIDAAGNVLVGGSFTNFLGFGGNTLPLGVGIANAGIFGTLSKASGDTLIGLQMVSADGQQASFQIGDRYPVIAATFSGLTPDTAVSGTLAPQVNYVDLGIQLKLTPTVHQGGEVTLDLDASFKTLGALGANGIPSIASRA